MPSKCRSSFLTPQRWLYLPVSIVARDGEQIELLAIASREAHPFARQAVDVGRLDELAAVATDRLPAMIVGHDDDDIRMPCAGRGGG